MTCFKEKRVKFQLVLYCFLIPFTIQPHGCYIYKMGFDLSIPSYLDHGVWLGHVTGARYES